uniref:Mei2-like C-terminal RNA recognition motif domain-containing protein n=1 Tax=Noctiluca scintillans TaxID=2966 RepID=A0A7S1APM5_NOCSC|mmetsp:Transcript_54954/g.146727  ORF Transcript_54954/g.146727 Transcript_54954/m.146727 type:complete len:266 (+) Transcript_54954:20-817(+)
MMLVSTLDSQHPRLHVPPGGVRTLMIQCVPHSYTPDALLWDISTRGPVDSLDMLYLPWDVKNRSNIGYAFINFYDADDAKKFSRAVSGHRWSLATANKKCCRIAPAHVQGISANLALFVNSSEEDRTQEPYAPIVFSHGRRLEFTEAVQMHCDPDVLFEVRRKRMLGCSEEPNMSVRDSLPDFVGGDVGCLPNHMPLFARTTSEKNKFIEASSASTAAPFDDCRLEIVCHTELFYHLDSEELVPSGSRTKSPGRKGPLGIFRISL